MGQCRKKLQRRGNMLACEDHEQVSKPKNLFFITTHMSDDTAQAKIVFFDAAATMLFHTDCNTIINQLGSIDPYTLPKPLIIIKGQTKIFQLHFTRSSKPGDIGLVANAVFEEVVVADEESQIQTHIINHSATSSATEETPVTTELASTAPATPQRFCHDHLASTLITPLSALTTTPPAANPNTQTTETKHHKQTFTKKQLFQTSSAEQDALPLKKQKSSVTPPDENIKGCIGARSTKKQ